MSEVIKIDRESIIYYRNLPLYIAGKYSDSSLDNVIENVRIARRYSMAFTELGFNVFSPHLNYLLFSLEKFERHYPSWEDVMANCIGFLRKCDAIFMIPGWESSPGSNIEYNLSMKLNIPRIEINFEDFGIDVNRDAVVDFVYKKS